jgi:DNA polymerase-3 subunit gamma/tau
LSFGGHRITVDDVNAMLGTADENRLASFAQCMIQRNAAGALQELDAALSEGVDPGQLAEQLLGYLRDMMALSIGGPVDLMRTASPNGAETLRTSGKSWGTMTLLSAMQLLDETIVRMKHSVQPRILLEVALVQICNLQDLQLLSDVVKGLATGHRPILTAAPPPQPPPAPPKPGVAVTDPSPIAPTVSEADSKKKEDELISAEAALEIFRCVVGKIDGVVQQAAWMTLEVQPSSSHRWRVLLARDAKFAIEWFRKPENQGLIQSALGENIGNAIELEWILTHREVPPGAKPAEEVSASPEPQRALSPGSSNQRIREAMGHPLVQKFMSTFEGHVFRVDDPASATIPPPKTSIAEEAEQDTSADA